MQIFISHSSADAETAIQICEHLERNGIRCFIAPRDIRLGKEYAGELVDGIDHSAAMVLLMSQNANRSPHVLREVERAVSKSIPILVYKLEEVALSKSMEYFLMTHQWTSAGNDENYVDILRFASNLEKEGQDIPKPVPKKRNVLVLAVIPVFAVFLIVFGIFFMAKRNAAKNRIAVGDTVTFGSYNGENIQWRVLKLSDDGRQAVLLSEDVLSMKAFDAAESGKYNWKDSTDYWQQNSEADTDMQLQAYVRGNSDWSKSNIRTWLNSPDEAVVYTDGVPVSGAMSERKNGYQDESGFLRGFREGERLAIVETEHTTAGNELLKEDTITTTDLVYLLSMEELQWLEDAGISKLAAPTQEAIAQDQSGWYILDYNDYQISKCSWWLRDPVEGSSSKCYLVGNGYTRDLLRQENAGLEGFGIRPALTVDLQKVTFREGKDSE